MEKLNRKAMREAMKVVGGGPLVGTIVHGDNPCEGIWLESGHLSLVEW